MVPAKHSNLFRPQALERSASPEQLDQLVQVVSPKRWLALTALGLLVSAGAAWSLFGQIPLTVTGQGVLVYPSDVVTAQSPGAGPLRSIEVKPGDWVKAGDILAVLDQSELETQLRLAQEKLTQLQIQDQTAQRLNSERSGLDEGVIAQQRRALEQNLRSQQSLTPTLQARAEESLRQERQALQQRLETLQARLPIYQTRWENWQRLADEGAMSQEEVLSVQLEYQELQNQVNNVETQLETLNLRDTEAQRDYLDNLSRIADLQAQIQDLNARAAAQAEQDSTTTAQRQKEIKDTEATIAQLTEQLSRNQTITSDHDGQVIEVMAQPGQRLEPGMPLAMIAAQDGDTPLTSVAFLPVSEGKKISVGMVLQATPTTVKREEYGGILGTVDQVSSFPVTQAGAARLVGHPDILPGIMGQGPYIAVFATLQPDYSPNNPSQLRWSASPQGPDRPMTPGMTTTVRITVEKRRPISYVLPILKQWAGFGDEAVKGVDG
jgi:HlyD family secretion protein